MLKTLLMVLKTLEMVLKPWWTLEKPYMGWRSINDPFCGHSCSDGVMVPQEKPSYPTGDIMLDHVVEVVKEGHEAPCLMKKPMKPLGMPNKPLEQQMG